MKRKVSYLSTTVVVPLGLALLLAGCGTQASGSSSAGSSSGSSNSNLAKSLAVNVSNLKSTDGQPLIQPAPQIKIPPRPANPDALPETNILHWWDMEYAGWDVTKVNQPKSPDNGAIGKTIDILEPGPHPYFTAYTKGAKEIANAYQMHLNIMVGDWTVNTQEQQVQEAINQHPDMIIIAPVDADTAVNELRQINQAGIPAIVSNLLPTNQAMQYALMWTGPDDWANMQLLADEFAKDMNYQGDYVIIRHNPGSSPYYSRTYAFMDELLKVAPKMHVLAMQTGQLNATVSQQLTSNWITRFGSQLKGIMSADDSNSQIGINQAVQNAHREDIVRVAAGNSKIGMQALQSGQVVAISYQSAQGDGALPVYEAAQWFDGKTLPPVRYLPMGIITKSNVSKYLPAQW
ncbi:sugar ABC transporter substrate-binding protein [Alicyclobacillus fastidiosus]|uniref:Sugar ABC transporter substrate-binding protein n=1 Tax=Alicyclobacillus fastidiosus TaxID=392011 RepID=A0ABY6ZN61_9BACL|nr:sugar ABC transporter substrate-binding protein [Alicyclobacillus fastidiosus]WAH44400.1 sugar ABC transporter substrate-binding protein [Alicyclobacillus fastidiosus]GMA60738.1 hypothetical protein GCM10025859_11780 [Alicyclobacillus fastidiosus]